jgi:hypothetical protein
LLNDEDLLRIIQDWRTLALGEGDQKVMDLYPSGHQTLFDAFDRTITADTKLDGSRFEQPQGFLFLSNALASRYAARVLDDEGGSSTVSSLESRLRAAMRAVQLRVVRRRFFITSGGCFGLGPRNAEEGDVVFVLLGCSVPVVLRRNGEDWSFVGEAFVAGIMDGEVAGAEPAVESIA